HGTVALVGGGPGDDDLLTVRGRRLLGLADVVVADRLAPQRVLAELRPEVEIVDAAKIPYGRAMAQEAINETLVERARQGKFVVRLKGGDSFLYGRGYEEALACAEAGVPCSVVPGVTSALAVPALAGIPATHRGMTHEVTVVSGHLPPGHEESLIDWDALARMRGTIVVLMGVRNTPAIAGALLAGGRAAATPAAVIMDGSLDGQTTRRCTLGTLAATVEADDVRPPAIVVVGDVAGLPQALSQGGGPRARTSGSCPSGAGRPSPGPPSGPRPTHCSRASNAPRPRKSSGSTAPASVSTTSPGSWERRRRYWRRSVRGPGRSRSGPGSWTCAIPTFTRN